MSNLISGPTEPKDDKSSINLTIVLIVAAGALAGAILGVIQIKDILPTSIFYSVLIVLTLTVLILVVYGFFAQKIMVFV